MRGRLSFHLASVPNVRLAKSSANSFICNILPITYLKAIFYGQKLHSPSRNFPESNILRSEILKPRTHRIPFTRPRSEVQGRPTAPARPMGSEAPRACRRHLIGATNSANYPANSLIWNILRVTHLDPIFCGLKCTRRPVTPLNPIFYVPRSKSTKPLDPMHPAVVRGPRSPPC